MGLTGLGCLAGMAGLTGLAGMVMGNFVMSLGLGLGGLGLAGLGLVGLGMGNFVRSLGLGKGMVGFGSASLDLAGSRLKDFVLSLGGQVMHLTYLDLYDVNRQYSGENKNGLKVSNLKSFDEIFAEELEITENTIRIQNDSDFIPNNKYLKNFEEISKIGRGSYGKVFKIKLKSSSELFAIKKIAINNENESLKELCTSLLISELNSDLIVRYHDVWYENDLVIENGFGKYTENSTLYIQMDLCDKTLKNICEEIANDYILKHNKLLSPLGYYITSELLVEILEGVDYLHKQNIIHRDLKPENILITNENNDRFVKIADFGYAKVLDEKKLHTQDRGTVKYMAPEVEFSQKYNLKADIYSLGLIVRNLFHIDFNGSDEENIPILLRSKYKKLKELIEKTTRIDFNKRPNCAELLEDKNSWSLGISEFNLSAILNELPKPFPFVYYMIETKILINSSDI